MRRLVRSLKTLDVYPKTEEEIAIQTGSGGMVSIVSFSIIAFLLLHAIWGYISPATTHSIMVDTRPTSQLQINFDIVFHALRCSETSIDVMDVSGDAQVAIETNIHRMRLAPDGRRIGAIEYEDHAHDHEVNRPMPINPLMIQLGFGGPGGGQQGPDQHVDMKGEGCHLVGTLSVNKGQSTIYANPSTVTEKKILMKYV